VEWERSVCWGHTASTAAVWHCLPSHAQTYGTPAGVIPAETTVLSRAIWSRPIAKAIPGRDAVDYLIVGDLDV
jgi:hypothetical protein